MQNAGEIRSSRRPQQQEWFGVWGVRNYYHKLDLQAQAGAEFNLGYFLLIIVAGLLATGGLLMNNTAVIIGAMCVAPFLGPSRAVCIGGLFLDKKIFWYGLLKQLVGLFIVGAGFSYLITTILIDAVPGIEITHEILLRAMPTSKDVVLTLIIAVAAGAGASLAFTADPHVVDSPWGQLLDVMIGVEIAISLIPPAAVIGKVDEFLVDPSNGHVTHIVMREGHLWESKEISIPISAVQHISEKRVYLNIDKAAVELLPEIPIRRGYQWRKS